MEEDSFSKYEGGYGQSAYDLKDDFKQPGNKGVGIVGDNGEILGYLYGYNMTDDELPDIENMSNDELQEEFGLRFFASVPENFGESLTKDMKSKKIFYIANLVLPTNKIKLAKMIKELITQIKSSGYKYVGFDALSDSAKLFMKGDAPMGNRISSFGLELVAIIPLEPGHMQALMRVK